MKATVQDNIVLGQIACTSGKKLRGATATVVSVIYQALLIHNQSDSDHFSTTFQIVSTMILCKTAWKRHILIIDIH